MKQEVQPSVIRLNAGRGPNCHARSAGFDMAAMTDNLHLLHQESKIAICAFAACFRQTIIVFNRSRLIILRWAILTNRGFSLMERLRTFIFIAVRATRGYSQLCGCWTRWRCLFSRRGGRLLEEYTNKQDTLPSYRRRFEGSKSVFRPGDDPESKKPKLQLNHGGDGCRGQKH